MITKEAELFEKANIVDVGLQHLEGDSYNNHGNEVLNGNSHLLENESSIVEGLREGVDKIDFNNNSEDSNNGNGSKVPEDEDDEVNFNIDEVDKVDNNLIVDEEFQRSLNERANQFLTSEGASINTNQFPQLPKPKIEYSYKDEVEFTNALDEWFTPNEISKFPEYEKAYYAKFTESFDEMSYDDKEDTLFELLSNSGNEDVQLKNLKCLLHLILGSVDELSNSELHKYRIKMTTKSLLQFNIIPWLLKNFNLYFEKSATIRHNLETASHSLFLTLTILYITVLVLIDSDRDSEHEINVQDFKLQLCHIDILSYIAKCIDDWRWRGRNSMRIRNIIILFSKTLHLLVGGFDHRDRAKTFLLQKYKIEKNEDPNKLTASPVDFHTYRQELTSRYPSYIPPKSTIPKTFEDSSAISQIIPFQRHQTKQLNSLASQVAPVHIATPAPSPPPSPGPKNGKAKRVFQSNTTFPLIYPVEEVDKSSNAPKSIIEASELFASRVRESLNLKQLWYEADLFNKQERESDDSVKTEDDLFDYFDDLDDVYQHEINSLNIVENFYTSSFPYFASIVQVLLKAIGSTTTTSEILLKAQDTNSKNINYDILRSKEIVARESSYIIILLLKWFKINHTLKFEYLSSVLYDSNFFSLMERYFKGAEDVYERIQVTKLKEAVYFHTNEELYETDQIDENFCFTLCNLLSITSKVLNKKTQRIVNICDLEIPSLIPQIFAFQNLQIWHPALKIVKEITPFSGKRWKSSNMNLISFVYLHQKLGLRDNWLSGRDIDAEISEGYGQEIALRGLIQFYHMRKYSVSMELLGYSKTETEFIENRSKIEQKSRLN